MGALEIVIAVSAALIVVGVAVSAAVRKSKGKGGCSSCGGCAGCPHSSGCGGKPSVKEGSEEKHKPHEGLTRSQEK